MQQCLVVKPAKAPRAKKVKTEEITEVKAENKDVKAEDNSAAKNC